MKKLLLLLIFALVVPAGKAEDMDRLEELKATLDADLGGLEGLKDYTPTRLEWLALEMDVCCRVGFLSHESYDFSIGFVPFHKEDTIIINVRYLPTVRREIMNREIDLARQIINRIAKHRGWDSWLKIKEIITLHENEE